MKKVAAFLLFAFPAIGFYAQKPELVIPIGHQINQAIFSKAGNQVFTTDRVTTKIWDTKSDKLLYTINGVFIKNSFTNDGKYFIVDQNDSSAIIEFPSLKTLFKTKGYSGSLNLSKDHRYIAKSSDDKRKTLVIDFDTHQILHVFDGELDSPENNAFSSDEEYILTKNH